MYLVTVEFVVRPEHAARFREEMVANAHASREVEEGCLPFDVSELPGNPATIFLYEVYIDRAAFDAHLASAHVLAFDAAVRDWIAGKTVRTYERVDPWRPGGLRVASACGLARRYEQRRTMPPAMRSLRTPSPRPLRTSSSISASPGSQASARTALTRRGDGLRRLPSTDPKPARQRSITDAIDP